MASNVSGFVIEYTHTCVHRETIDRLRAYLASEPEALYFNCDLCGAEQKAKVTDPGALVFRDFTCADVKTCCKRPPPPKTPKRPIIYRPGSLVLARIDEPGCSQWPGMIEDCPDGTDGYCIRGKTGNVKAYHVTFIFPQGESRWIGGFIQASEIKPLKQPISTQSLFGPTTALYKGSLARALEAIPLSLKERLMKFSFVAHVAMLRNVPLDMEAGSCLGESSADGKQKHSRSRSFPCFGDGRPSHKVRKSSLQSGQSREPLDEAPVESFQSTSSGTVLGNVGPYVVRRFTARRDPTADSESD